MNKGFRIFSLFVGWLVGYSVLIGQNVSIQAQLNRAEMKTGEQAVIDMVIRTNDLANTQFRLSDGEEGPQRFVVLDFAATDTIDIDAQIKEIQAKMLITSFDSTLIVIPPIVVQTPTEQAQTEPMALNVIQPEVDVDRPEKFKAIKDPWAVAWGVRDILLLILYSPFFWLVLLLLISGYAYYRYRQLPRRELGAPAEPIKPVQELPIESVRRELERIEQMAYWRSGDYKVFYSQVIEALKRYIYAVRGWHVLEMTTSELNDYLYNRGEDKDLRTVLERLQRDADLSKFAKSQPMESDARASLSDARLFVERSAALWATDNATATKGLQERERGHV